MPLDAASHTFLHGGGGFLRNRYAPLPPLHENTPTSSASSSPSQYHTEVRLSGDRPRVHVRQTPPASRSVKRPVGRTQPNYSPISRPCMRFRHAGTSESPRMPRYSKLADNDSGSPCARISSGGGSGGRLLRAVVNRGRGYEDLRCRGPGGNPPDSGGSSPANSPRDSPIASPRGPQSGILITSALAKSGIKRLSRVSFGSSKGSMVETLIYDSPVAEEDRIPEEELFITDPVAQKLGTETAEPQKPASKVRVTFFECEKPLAVTSPEPPDLYGHSLYDLPMSSPAADTVLPSFDRQLSNESGRDNPFRPDGDISREADEIVQKIKSGQPLETSLQSPDTTDTPNSPLETSPLVRLPDNSLTPSDKLEEAKLVSPLRSGVKNGTDNSSKAPGPVEIKHATVTPSEPAQVEHVVLKKNKKSCGCCVLQ